MLEAYFREGVDQDEVLQELVIAVGIIDRS